MYAIEVDNLTKIFNVVHRESTVKQAVLKRIIQRRKPVREHFTALHDISFKVPRGQTVGLIGRNGSGKSTLLTLMAHIYRPTSGQIVVHGRLAALLALGAGFMPDYTGLQNILLNGLMMGFSQEELEARLEAIIDFAEVGEFIDTAVKHYSTGMQARLGFAVAIHTDPDVLLVDEALAVGDLRFQEKCFARLLEMKDRGVTIFFVSHDMRAVRRVSDRVLWIDNHELRGDGPPDEVVPQFEAALAF